MNTNIKSHLTLMIRLLTALLLLPSYVPENETVTKFTTVATTTNLPTIAITQIVEHPSLDQERAGILAALNDAGYVEGKNLKVIYQNAQGNTVTSTQIAQKFVSIHPDVIIAISTPSAQSVRAAIGNSKIPMVFTAVTDPVGARLSKSLEHPGPGITGVSDHPSPEPQLRLISSIVPQLKTLGVIYNPGESNSNSIFRELEAKAPSLNIHLIASTASRTSEVSSAAQSLIGRVEAIYIPIDNTAVSALESVLRVAQAHHLPVFAGDLDSVARGALGGTGYDRTTLGRLAGERVVRFLKGGYSQEIAIASDHPVVTVLNRSAALKMGVQLPLTFPQSIVWVGGDQ